jgi:hypothetical protein
VRLTASHELRLTIFALLAFALRASIPAGFMPSAVHPLTLMVCHEGMHHAHPGTHTDHCPFGAASLPGPAPNIATVVLAGDAPAPHLLDFGPVPFDLKLVQLPQPRGPPALV